MGSMETKNIFVALIVFICFFSTNCFGAIIDVGPGTSFNPTGSDDQEVINAAIESADPGDTVQLAASTFHISAPINMKSGVTLNGKGIGATVIYCDDPRSNFEKQNIINCNETPDIEISNFLIDGGWESLSKMHSASNKYRSYEKGVRLSGCSNAVIHDLKMQYSMGDFIYCSKKTSNVTVYNTVCKPGHDSFDAWSAGDGISVFNNCWGTFINSCIKVHKTKNVQIYKNTFYTDAGSGNAGVEIMGGDVTGLNVHNNIFSALQLNTVYHDPADGECSGEGTVSNNIFYNSPPYDGIDGMEIKSTGNKVTDSYSSSKSTKDCGYIQPNGTRNLPAYNGSVKPSVTFPTNCSTISTVNGYVPISWTYLNATGYSVNVYNSASKFDSSHLVYSLNTSQTTANIPISSNGQFAVKIAAHDDIHNSWVYSKSASLLTVSGKNKTPEKVHSGIFGYLTDAATGQPIQYAVVTLSSDKQHYTQITDVDGLYHFMINDKPSEYKSNDEVNGRNREGKYSLTVSATGYHKSSEVPVNLTGLNTETNLKMVKAPDYCDPHYVKLYVATDSEELVPGCEVRIYAPNNDPSDEKPNLCGWTNKEGRVNFHLTEGISYKIIVITPEGQKYTDTLTPDLDQYTITLSEGTKFTDTKPSDTTPSDDTSEVSSIPPMKTVISTDCKYKEINDTAAYINASYFDSSSKSSDLNFVLGNMNDGKTFVPLEISGTNDHISEPVGKVTDSFIVTNYSGNTYTVKISAQSQTYGAVREYVNVSFPAESPGIVPYAGSNMSYFCALVLIIAGLVLSKIRKEH